MTTNNTCAVDGGSPLVFGNGRTLSAAGGSRLGVGLFEDGEDFVEGVAEVGVVAEVHDELVGAVGA